MCFVRQESLTHEKSPARWRGAKARIFVLSVCRAVDLAKRLVAPRYLRPGRRLQLWEVGHLIRSRSRHRSHRREPVRLLLLLRLNDDPTCLRVPGPARLLQFDHCRIWLRRCRFHTARKQDRRTNQYGDTSKNVHVLTTSRINLRIWSHPPDVVTLTRASHAQRLCNHISRLLKG